MDELQTTTVSRISKTDDLVNQFEVKEGLDYHVIVAQSEHAAN